MVHPNHSTYLYHINGLRGIAIIGVLIYHLQSSFCPAGYFGVDLFLVISGFFLFRSLLFFKAGQKFHYGDYLLKKAWRIIPSWFIVTIVVCSLALFCLPAERLDDILKTARASALLHADYYIDESGDYFNVFSQQNPLLHFWFLSITLQLYIIAPFLILPWSRLFSTRTACLFLALIALCSLVYYISTTTIGLVPETVRELCLSAVGTKTSYYHLFPRFWEIAAGAGVFLLPEMEAKPKLRAILGGLALSGIAISFYLYRTGSPAVYLTVFSAMFALRYASTGVAAKLLNCKLLQSLGTISFSLYLWHWPIMVAWKYYCFDRPENCDLVGMTTCSILFACLSWWGIERMKMPTRIGPCGMLLRVSLILSLPFVAISIQKSLQYLENECQSSVEDLVRFRADFIASPEIETDASVLRGLENLPKLGMDRPVLRLGLDSEKPVFLFIGDSHAAHLYDDLHRVCQQAKIRGVYLNNQVVPYWNLTQPIYQMDVTRWSKEVAETLMSYLQQHPEIRYVLIAQCWNYRLKCTDGAPREIMGWDWRTDKTFASSAERLAVTVPGLEEFCDRLLGMDKIPVLLGDTPMFANPFPVDEWARSRAMRRRCPERFITQDEHINKQAFPHKILSKLAEKGKAYYIDPAPALMENGVYPARTRMDIHGDNAPFLYQDAHHLTPHGAQKVADFLLPYLQGFSRMEDSQASGRRRF